MTNMDESSPNYEHYSLAELHEAKSTIDKEAFPERLAMLEQLIAQFDTNSADQKNFSTNAPPVKALRSVPVQFLGNGREFFNIWIVNLLLTIATLGIYSAWATVRNNRYLYSNVEIDGHRMSYLATPKQILIGRAIGVLLFASYYVLSVLSPFLSGLLLLLLFALTPMLVCMSIRFRMRMTGYRNVRFGFTVRYGRAFVVFVLYTLLALVTFGILYPLLFKKIDEFIYENMTYGDAEFETDLSTGEYFLATIAAGVIAGVVIAILIGVSIGVGAAAFSSADDAQPISQFLMIGMLLLYVIALAISSSIYKALIRNHVFTNTQITNVARFDSKVSVMGLIYLRLTNLALLVCTLGFAMPWIKVRSARFFAKATTVDVLPGYEEVIASAEESTNAIGDEVSSVFDVDVAIG